MADNFTDRIDFSPPDGKINITANVSGEAKIKELADEVDALTHEVNALRQANDALKESLRDTESEFQNYRHSIGTDVLEEQIAQFSSTAERAVREYKNFLKSINLDVLYDSDLEYWEENIRSGTMTLSEAISNVKAQFRELIESNYGSDGGLFDKNMVTSFTAALEALKTKIDEVATAMKDMSTNGVPVAGGSGSASAGADFGAAHLKNLFDEIHRIVEEMNSGGLQTAYQQIEDLVRAINDLANQDVDKLNGVYSSFRQLALIGQGHFGKSTIANIEQLIDKLQTLKGGDRTLGFEFKGLEELENHKGALNSFMKHAKDYSEFYKAIKNVDTQKMQDLANINFDNLSRIKVDKKSLQAIADWLNNIQNAKGGGGKGQKSDAVSETERLYKRMMDLRKQYTRAQTKGYTGDYLAALQNELNAATQAFQQHVQQLTAQQKDMLRGTRERLESNERIFEPKVEESAINSWNRLKDKVNEYIRRVEDAASRDPKAREMLNDLREAAKGEHYRGFDELNKKLAQTQEYINANDLATEKWYQRMLKTFGTRVRSLLAGLILGKVTLYLHQVYTNVVEIDSAMTQLKIVTGASDYQMTKFLTNATKLAKELGASIKDVLASVETFSRLGYNIEDSTVLAQYANILSRVADVSSDQATTGLTSIIKGYGFDPNDAQHVADVLIEVGQKYAVSASELMEAYQKAGAALNATNTTFEKSAGLIAAANASVQDASVVGTALKTVAARIRTSKTDLEELGESTEDLAEGFSKYADEIRALTGFNIMEGDSKTQYKDLYDIMLGISEVWDTLSDTAQSRVAAILGGTRQFTVIASILSNMKDATGAYDDALNSAGTSTQALAIYTDSIQGRVDKLQAGFEEFSVKLLNSDLIKAGTDFLGIILKVADGLVWIIDNGYGLTTLIISLTGLIATLNADKIVKNFGKFTEFFKSLPSNISDIILTFQLAREQNDGFFTALSKSAHEAGIEISAAGAAISLVTVGITMVTTAWNVITKIQQERTRAAIESAERAKQEYEELTKTDETLSSLIQRYKELANEKGGYWKPDAAKEVRSIQDQIVNLVGDQATQLDLVNGKLKEETALLDGIAQSQGELTRQQAEKALKEADIAIRNKMEEWLPGLFGAYNIGGFDSEDYGDITTTGKRGFAWQDFLAVLSPFAALVNNAGTKSIRKDFDNAEEFVRQYEAVVDWVNNKAKTLDVDDSAAVEYYQNAQRYLSDFRDVYEAYQSAKSVVDGFNKETAPEAQSSVTRNIIIPLRSVEAILGETEEAYDALTAAMEDMEKQGYLSAASLKKLLELETSGAFKKLGEIEVETGKYYIDQASKDWKNIKPELERLSNEYNALVNGNVDYMKRPWITPEHMRKYYPEFDGSIATTYDQTYGVGDWTVLITPILEDGTVLTQNALDEYVNSLFGTGSLNDLLDSDKDRLIIHVEPGAYDKAQWEGLLEKLGDVKAAHADILMQYAQAEKIVTTMSISDFLEQTAYGYKLNADAMERWINALITYYTTAKDIGELSTSDINNAISNLKNLQTVLATLALTANKEKSAAEKRKDALNDEKDALKEQLDAYKKLIDIRKELLKQTQDELNYQRELEKKQEKVATLEAQVAASRLDNSAAGRARTRKLEEDLKSARQDLDDFTLEHAIEVLTKELDNQYEEYKALIDGDLKGIESQIAALSESNKNLSAALQNAADKIQALIEEYESHRPEELPIPPKDPRDRRLYDDRNAGAYENEQAEPVIIWDERRGKFIYATGGGGGGSQHNKYQHNVLTRYHSGGVVGNDARLKSTEEFAKLLKGEFVSTPAQMKRFMEFTLPSLLQSGDTTAGNEFNSPLIEINCETVSAEAIPKVKAVVEDAVNEIKKMFDDGFSRTGFKKTTKKFLI